MPGLMASTRPSIAGGHELDAAAVARRRSCPARGIVAPVELGLGLAATWLMRACTSRPSKSGESAITWPPDCPKPRASQVSTLKPAAAQRAQAHLPEQLLRGGVGVAVARSSRSRGPRAPWAPSAPGSSPSAGKKCVRIFVPSKDVTTASRAERRRARTARAPPGRRRGTGAGRRARIACGDATRRGEPGDRVGFEACPSCPRSRSPPAGSVALWRAPRWSRRSPPAWSRMKTFDPPLDALAGAAVEGVRRRGKMFVVALR